ncbi:sorting nexin-27-like [Dendronephthya gigantea]|uniref:sorting nexin-27-like n=1 Tax=Dendronephthya gigantea TaxID=151771 RepID=UPI00106C769B|nr:sorting nexin-27-like [Dendronephthya gigantea]
MQMKISIIFSNEENVEGATHKHVVELIKSGGRKLSMVVLSLPPSEVRKLDPPEDGQAPEYFDYSDKRQIFVTIPETRQIDNGREKYAVFNIYVNDRHICSRRYKEFSNLNNELKKQFQDYDFPKFPGKWPFQLSEQQLDNRRKALELYLEQVTSIRIIHDCDAMKEFMKSSEEVQVNNLEVELKIALPDQTERPVKVEKSFQTQDVCKAFLKKIGMSEASAKYFALFEIIGKAFERKLRDNEFPHTIYIRNYSSELPSCLVLRKWVFTLPREIEMDDEELAFNLLYDQAVDDVRTLKIKSDEKFKKLEEYKSLGKKAEYLKLARSLQDYGCVRFPHCECDARKKGHVIVSFNLNSIFLQACSVDGEPEVYHV